MPMPHLAAAGSRLCCSPPPGRAAGPRCLAWVSHSPSQEAWPARSPRHAPAAGARTAGTRTSAGTRRTVRHHTAGSLPTMHQSTEGRPGLCPAYLHGHTHTHTSVARLRRGKDDRVNDPLGWKMVAGAFVGW